MWKNKKTTPIEKLRKNNRLLRSNWWLAFWLSAGIIVLLMTLNVRKKIEEVYNEAEEIGLIETIVISQGMNFIFISSCVAGVFLGAAFALKFRPTSKSEIIVELSDRIEQLEKEQEAKP